MWLDFPSNNGLIIFTTSIEYGFSVLYFFTVFFAGNIFLSFNALYFSQFVLPEKSNPACKKIDSLSFGFVRNISVCGLKINRGNIAIHVGCLVLGFYRAQTISQFSQSSDE